jgi:hypothetical protein
MWNFVVCFQRPDGDTDHTFFVAKPEAKAFFDNLRASPDYYKNVYLCEIIEGRFPPL